MAKATKGDWRSADGYVFSGRNCIAICDTDNATPAIYAANARLMAAAPDLLACLKETLAIATRNEEGEFADRARMAIARAEGQS
jgi:hypothetical protein